MSHSRLGPWGEAVAREHLEAKGLAVEAVNWRCPAGEIDIVARDGQTWVFVEVKTRVSDRFGSPQEAVTGSKLERMLSAALEYLSQRESVDPDWRIDVVAIVCTRTRQVLSLEHLTDVVTRLPRFDR